MGQLRNLLRGLGGNCSRGFLPRGKRGRSAKHMESCPECASLLWRERQYLERMRRAAIPAASDDLTARLLARTQHLAMAPPSAAARPPVPASPAVKVLGLAAGGALAAAGVVAGAAYFLAGDPGPWRPVFPQRRSSSRRPLSGFSPRMASPARRCRFSRLAGFRRSGFGSAGSGVPRRWGRPAC